MDLINRILKDRKNHFSHQRYYTEFEAAQYLGMDIDELRKNGPPPTMVARFWLELELFEWIRRQEWLVKHRPPSPLPTRPDLLFSILENTFGNGEYSYPPYRARVGLIKDWDEEHFGPYPYIVMTAYQLDSMAIPTQPKEPSIYADVFVTSSYRDKLRLVVHNIGGSCWQTLCTDEIILNPMAASLLDVKVGKNIIIRPTW
ncbi:MAG: hypothetical protein H8D67_30905 [Deltaproteobacteria bacterium]|nr:hypothetical protein [Deltaproteobacteria bacterium]